MQTIIKTAYGHVAFTPTDISHIYIELAPTSSDLNTQGRKYSLPFVVRGVSYYGSIHVHRWDDGEFRIGPNTASYGQTRESIYLRRNNPSHPSNDRASDSAERTILQTLLPLVNAWAAANPYILDAAEQERITSSLADLEQKRADLVLNLAEVDAQIAALRPHLRTIETVAA